MDNPEQNGTPEPVKQPWIVHTWERLRGLFWHDVVVGQVEEGAQNVVIGKNIIQIGSLQIPFWLATVLGVTLVIIAVAATTGTGVLGGILYRINQPIATPPPTLTPVPTPTPTRMALQEGFVKIVVADISKQQTDGTQVASQLGRELSGQIYSQLTAEYNQHLDLKQGMLGEVKIWSGSTLPDAVNRPIHWVAGKDAQEREQNARQMSEEISADLLIYGHLTDETPASLVMEFYYRAQPNRLELDGAQGRYQLGEPLPLPVNAESDPGFARLNLGMMMDSRLKTIAWLTVALVYSMLEQHTKALDLLRQGEQQLCQDEPQKCQTENGPTGDGLDVFYYFAGREALLLQQFDEAEHFFTKAKVVNERYARAYLGLGMLYYDRAQLYYLSLPSQSAPSECVPENPLTVGDKSAVTAEADIQRALAAYQQAQQFATETAAYPPIDKIAQLNTATAWQLQAQALSFAGDFAGAQTIYAQAATVLEALLPAFSVLDYQRFTGATYLSLGQSYHGQGIALWNLAQQANKNPAESTQGKQAAALLRQAADQYAQCIALADGTDTSDLFLQKRIINCGCRDSQTKVLEQVQTIGGGDG